MYIRERRCSVPHDSDSPGVSEEAITCLATPSLLKYVNSFLHRDDTMRERMLRACLPETEKYGRNVCISCFFIPLRQLRKVSLTLVQSFFVQRNVSQ